MANISYSIDFKVNQKGLAEAKKSLQEIQRLSGTDIGNIDIQNAVKSAKELEHILDRAYNTKLDAVNLTKFNQLLEEGGHTLTDYYNDLTMIGPRGNKAFNELSSGLLTTNLNLKQSNKLLDDMAKTMSNTIKWGIASSLMNSFTGEVQRAYGYIKNLDKSLNNIRIVTGKSAEEMRVFAKEANSAAKDLSSATLEYTDASLIYYQQGLGDAEVKARAEVTLKAANVAKTSAEEMSEYLTAVWNGYKVEAAEAELYIDKLSKVAASTASDLEELSVGMSKVASVANSMGVNVDQLNGMLSTVISVTRQAPESAGVAFKTIFSRINDLSLGETDEDGIDFGTVNTELEKLGISIADETGKLRDLGEVVEEVGVKWQTWTTEQKTAIAVAMAGRRQYNNLFALFDNWDMYTKAVQDSAEAVGTLQEQQDIYAESAEAGLKELSTSFERIFGQVMDGRSINIVADGVTLITDAIGDFVDNVGGGLGLAVNLSSTLAGIFDKKISRSIVNATTQLKSFVQTQGQSQQIASLINQVNGVYGSSDLAITVNDIESSSDKKYAIQVNMVKDLLKYKGYLTDEEIQSYQNEVKKVGVLEQQKILLKQVQEKMKDDNFSIDTRKSISELEKFQRDAGSIFNSLSNKTGQDLTNLLLNFEESFNRVHNIVGVDDNSTTIKNAFEKLHTTGLTAKELVVLQNNLYSFSNRANVSLGEQKETLERINEISNGQLDNLNSQIDSHREISRQMLETAEQAEKVNKIMTTVELTMQGISLVTSAVNLGEMWSDDTIEAGEKFSSTLSTVAGLLPGIIVSGAQLAPILQGIGGAATQGSLLAGLAGVSALGVAGAIAGVVAALAVAAVAYDKIVNKIENQREALEKSNQAYQETIANLQTINDELETNRDRINELLAKGTLTYIEQEELDKLKLANSLLMQQKIEEEKAQEEAKKEKLANADDLLANYMDEDGSAQGKLLEAMGQLEATEDLRRRAAGGEGISLEDQVFAQKKLDKWGNFYSGLEEGYSDYYNDLLELEQIYFEAGDRQRAEQIRNLRYQFKEATDEVGIINEQALDNLYLLLGVSEQEFLKAYNEVGGSIEKLKEIFPGLNSAIESSGFLFAEGATAAQAFGDAIKGVSGSSSDMAQSSLIAKLVSAEGKTIDGLTELEKIGREDLAKSILAAFGEDSAMALNFVNQLTPEQISFSKESGFDDEKLKQLADEYKIEQELLALRERQKKEMEQLNSAISTLREGEQLEAETVTALEKKYAQLKSVRDKSSKEYLSMLEAISEYEEDQLIQAKGDETSIFANTFKENLEEGIDTAKEELDEFLNSDYSFNVSVETDFTDDFNDIIHQLETIKDAASMIGEGFVVAAEDVAELGQAFPGILEDITYLKDGTIKLNKDIAQSAIEAANAEMDADADAAYNQLMTMGDLYATKAEIYGEMAKVAGELAQTEITNEKEKSKNITKLSTLVTNLDEKNKEIMAENATDEAQAEIDNLVSVATQSRHTGEDIALNLGAGWQAATQSAIDGATSTRQSLDYAAGKTDTLGKPIEVTLPGAQGSGKKETVTNTFKGKSAETEDLIETWSKDWEAAQKDFLLQQKSAERLAALAKNQAAEILARRHSTNTGLTNIKNGKDWDGKGGSKTETLVDLYHDINNELSLVEKNLTNLQEQEDKLFGEDKLRNLAQQKAFLEAQNKLLREKQEIQNTDLETRKTVLQQLGVQLDERGIIQNYNALINNEEVKKFMDEYEELYFNSMEEVRDELISNEDAIFDIFLKEFTFKVDLEVDVDAAKKEWKEFLDEMADYQEDNLIDPLKANIGLFDDLISKDSSIRHLTTQVNEIIDELEQGEDGKFAGREAEGIELLKEYQSQLQNALTELNGLQEEIEKTYLDFIEKSSNEFNEHIEQFDRVTEILSHQKTLIESIYGDEAYSLFGQAYDAQHRNNVAQLDFFKKQLDYWTKLQKTFDEGSNEWNAINEQIEGTQSNLNSLIEESLTTIAEQYENTINSIFNSINSSLTDGLGLEFMGEQWDNATYLQDKYLDNTEKIIELQKLENKLNDAINSTDDIKAQEKIKETQNYLLTQLREKGQLTQYDLDRAEALYQITLKQIALEDAKNAKTSMRLVRNAQGNWDYQYTADQNAINTANNDLTDAYGNLYAIDKEGYQQNLDEMYNIYQEWQEKLIELAQDRTLSDEEQELKRLEYADYYGGLIDSIVAENQIFRQNITASTYATIAAIYEQDKQNVVGLTQAEMELVTQMTENFKDNYFGFEESVKGNWDEINLKTDDTMTNILGIWDSSIQAMISRFAEDDDSFRNICLEVYAQIDNATVEYENRLQELEDAANINFTNISESIEDTSSDTVELTAVTDDLIRSLNREWNEVETLVSKYYDLADAYETIERKAMRAAEAAYELVEAMQETAAHSDGGEFDFSSEFGGSNYNSSSSSSSSGGPGGEPSGPNYASTSNSEDKQGIAFSGYTLKVDGHYYDYGTRSAADWGAKEFKKKNKNPSEPKEIKVIPKSAAGSRDVRILNYRGPWQNDFQSTSWGIFDHDYAPSELRVLTSNFRGGVVPSPGPGDNAIISAKSGERILSERQTNSFDSLVYDVIPTMISAIKQMKYNQVSNSFSAPTTSTSSSGGNTYHIEKVEFPNATNKEEIIAAFENLSGIANQFVNNKVR